MEEFLHKLYLFVIGLPFVVAGWITKKIIANDKRIDKLEQLVQQLHREFEVRDKQRMEDREILKEMRGDIKDLMGKE